MTMSGNTVIADDDVWDSYIKENPDAQSYRMKILASYNDLCKIYGTGNDDTRESPDEEDLEIVLEASCINNDVTL
ncbi:hypothetical protein Sjap_010801 [Stephania japonica]|uniref:Uncharacterized protein n=1 Tax=Stephania japonica TaxID=461633 RepID=A0AAP0P4W6_9MAGN